jgi:TolB protein
MSSCQSVKNIINEIIVDPNSILNQYIKLLIKGKNQFIQLYKAYYLAESANANSKIYCYKYQNPYGKYANVNPQKLILNSDGVLKLYKDSCGIIFDPFILIKFPIPPPPPFIEKELILYTSIFPNKLINIYNNIKDNNNIIFNQSGAVIDALWNYTGEYVIFSFGVFPPKLYSINFDGTNLIELTTVNLLLFVLNDTNKINNDILYTQGDFFFTTRNIFKINRETLIINQLTTDNVSSDGQYNNSGTQIVYVQDSSPTKIGTMNSDGTNQISYFITNFGVKQPSYSPDDTEIVFTELGGTFGRIWKMNSDGTNMTILTSLSTLTELPKYSPLGNKIAFLNATDGLNKDIYLMNTDGSSQTKITDSNIVGPINSYSFNKYGTKIVFSGGNNIYILSLLDMSFKKITDNPILNNVNPYFSPISNVY